MTMNNRFPLARRAAIFTAVFVASGLLAVKPGAAATPAGVTMTVTAVGKHDTAPPLIHKEDVLLHRGNERLKVLEWKRTEQLSLVILIDDALDSSVAGQFEDLKQFITSLPETASVAVAYTRFGGAQMVQNFTTDHSLAAKALRIPFGESSATGSPYLSLQDLMKNWPETGGRRAVVLVSSGIDYLRGDFGRTSPDLDATIERAQRSNIVLYAIYAKGIGHARRMYFRVFNAQSNLSQLAAETGGEAFYLGFGAPVSFRPYLDEIRDHLNNQYLLTFEAPGGQKGRYVNVRLTTEVPGVEFLAPSAVFLPAEQ